MRGDTKFRWGCLIFNSTHTQDILEIRILAKPASKKDFERLVGCGENNGRFNKFFNELILKGVLKGVGKLENGNRNSHAEGFVCLGSKMASYLSSDKDTASLYELYKNVFLRGRI